MDITYQGSAIVTGRKATYTRNSKAARDGAWIDNDKFRVGGMSAIKCVVTERDAE